MPPKRQKSGKTPNQSSVKSARPTLRPQGEVLNESSKEYYLVQIRDLESRLSRYQSRCDELEVKNGEFNQKLSQVETDKSEIVSFWKRQVETKSDEIADLNDRYVGLQQTRDNERDQYELQIQQHRNEYQEVKDQLTSENMIMGGKLASLEEFKVQKEDLMAKFAMIEEELRKKDEDGKENIYALEKKAVIDKDRLKKEMILRVNQVASEFRKVSNKQMAETTKRTIRENVAVNAQLSKVSDKTVELITENDQLMGREKQHRKQIELLESNEKELSRKSHSSQKIIRMLTEKCRNQEEIISELEVHENEFHEVDMESRILHQQLSASREDVQTLACEQDKLLEKIRSTEQEKADQQYTVNLLESTISAATDALRTSLRSTSPEDGVQDGRKCDSASDKTKCDRLLEQLLRILNSASHIGVGPDPGDLGKQYEQTVGAICSPSSGNAEPSTLSPMLLSKRNPLPHYTLGDLGFIPRPDHNIPSFLNRTRDSTGGTHLRGLRRVLTHSVAVQTVNSSKALFYADQLLNQESGGTGQHAKKEMLRKQVIRQDPLSGGHVGRKLPLTSVR